MAIKIEDLKKIDFTRDIEDLKNMGYLGAAFKDVVIPYLNESQNCAQDLSSNPSSYPSHSLAIDHIIYRLLVVENDLLSARKYITNQILDGLYMKVSNLKMFLESNEIEGLN